MYSNTPVHATANNCFAKVKVYFKTSTYFNSELNIVAV